MLSISRIMCQRLNSIPKRMFSIREQKIIVKGQNINYVKTGQGAKTVLCVPGALGTIWSDFKPQITALDKSKFTIIALDPPGYGYSRPPERNFCQKFYENDADTAYEFMKKLGFKKFSLLGWSDGGISSIILCGKYPDVIDKLVVWGANSYISLEDINSYEKIRDISQWSAKMKVPLIELYTETGLQKMWNSWCDTMLQIYTNNNGNLCKEFLSQIRCETLILHGDKDTLVADEHPRYLVSNISGARLHRFSMGNHNIHLRYFMEFNEVITSFLSESVNNKDQ